MVKSLSMRKNVPFRYIRSLKGTILEPYLNAPELCRLKNVGMHCGLEYTSFPFYSDLRYFPYSRYEHSLGVAAICLRFSDDPKVAISALFHDISTPCFSHVVDFLHGDYEKQEYTEGTTARVIASSKHIVDCLKADGLTVDDVSDYHRYPIADNDSPKLSSDRLEYSLSNFLRFGLLPYSEVRRLYDDLEVSINEYGEEELCFRHLECAITFATMALENGKIYSADEDRFSMEYLATRLRKAIDEGIIDEEDLMTDEPSIIAKLNASDKGKRYWAEFTSLSHLEKSHTPIEGGVQINGKLRYIDPYVLGQGRASELSPSLKGRISEFLAFDFKLFLKKK